MEGLSPVAAFIYRAVRNPEMTFWFLYAVVVLFSATTYRLGFAKKLPLLKNVVIYILLFVGCFPLAVFAIRFPVAESLMVMTLVLAIYKIRLQRSKKKGQS